MLFKLKHRNKLHVEMLLELTGLQSTETSCMQGYWSLA